MNLETWMSDNKLTDQTVSEAVGVTRSYISRIRYGQVHPSLGVALAIWDYTGRRIELVSLLPKHWRVTPPQPVTPVGTPRRPAVRKASKSRAAA
jgi:transcriptional regulator with XRE-family HTH domain